MKPYSKGLGIRVLAVVDCGVPRQKVAETFSVSVPTIKRWLRRRETSGVESKTIPGHPRVKGVALEGWLPSHLEKNHESICTVGRAISRSPGGWPLKKSLP